MGIIHINSALLTHLTVVNSPDQLPDVERSSLINASSHSESPGESELTEASDSMSEYYQLKQELLIITLVISLVVFGSVWVFYSLNIALNYLLGACTSVVYLRMLAKNVERLGEGQRRLGKSHLALFIGLIILATQLNQLKVLPIFLGFLTYKATLLIFILRSSFSSSSS